MIGFNGGLIGKTRSTSAQLSVPGVWTAREQEVARRNSTWPGGIPDPFFSNVSLLLHGDGPNFTDSSASNKTISAIGGVAISSAQSKFTSSSILFNGTNAALTIPAAVDCNFGTGDFTIESWFYPLSETFTDGSLIAGRGPTSGTLMIVLDNNKLRIGRNLVAFDNESSVFSSTTQWYHIAYSRTGTTLRMFRDGVQLLSTTNTQSYNLTSGSDTSFAVGARQLSSGSTALGSFLSGYVNELRVTKGIGRYTGDFPVPTAPFPNF